MAASTTEIANLALSHLGVGKEIAALDTERSEEARACRAFYETARDEMLRGWPWPFARKFAEPTLVDEDPTDEWAYSYRMPSDCLFVRRILSGDRNDSRQTRIAYSIGYDPDGLALIYTDQDDPTIEYTVKVTDVTKFAPDFVMALSYRLAAYVAPRLTKGDPFKMADRTLKLYDMSARFAAASAFNEEQVDEEVDSEFERMR